MTYIMREMQDYWEYLPAWKESEHRVTIKSDVRYDTVYLCQL